MIVSHSQQLAATLADQIRKIMQSDWYCRAFDTRLRDDFDRQMHFQTSAGGGVFATSVEAGVTGHGADIMIFDDPLDAGDAYAHAARTRLNELFDGKFASRLNNQSHGRVLIVHQRLHVEDFTAHLLTRGGFERFYLPLVATEAITYDIDDAHWERPEGDILDPTNYNAEAIERIKRVPEVYEAQYQQRPIAGSGNLLKREWFTRQAAVPTSCDRVTLSFDLAQSSGENSSYSCCLVFSSDGTEHYLRESLRRRADYTEIKLWVVALLKKYSTATILIEEAAFGVAIISELKAMGRNPIAVPRPTKSKEVRVHPHLDLLAANRVHILSSAVGCEDFLDEVVMFPNGINDDQIDCLTQYLDFCRNQPERPRHLVLGVTSHPTDRLTAYLNRPRKPGSPYPLRDPKNRLSSR